MPTSTDILLELKPDMPTAIKTCTRIRYHADVYQDHADDNENIAKHYHICASDSTNYAVDYIELLRYGYFDPIL